jgi:hypothetical protein
MDIIRLYQDFGIEYLTEGHKHATQGHVNTHCPFCSGSRDFHLGFNIHAGVFHCWRCGWHPLVETLARLLGMSESQVFPIVQEYGGKARRAYVEPIIRVRAKAHRLPSDTGPMGPSHRKYLKQRGFDPDELEREWGLLGTGPLSLLDGVHYSRRIIIPIFWEGERVSFQGRDITGKSNRKYMACPEERELVKHKHILYRHPKNNSKDCCIVVEGVTDAWRVGTSAVATFGIKYTKEQLRILRTFRRVVVWFDQEDFAQEQAHKLIMELSFGGVETDQIFTPKDPADTDPERVRRIVGRYLGG